MGKPVISDIERCARCGESHEQVQFAPFTNPVKLDGGRLATHWSPCPTNGEPILMRPVVQDGED